MIKLFLFANTYHTMQYKQKNFFFKKSIKKIWYIINPFYLCTRSKS